MFLSTLIVAFTVFSFNLCTGLLNGLSSVLTIYLPFLVGFSLSYSFCLLFHLEETLQHFFKSKVSTDKVTTLVFACLRSILGYRVFLSSTLNMCAIRLWPAKFLQRNQQIALWGLPGIQLLVFLLLSLEFSLSI